MSWLTESVHWLVRNPPIFGGVISGGCTLLAASVITWRLTKGIKRAEFVLTFTTRYHSLLVEKHRLNKQFESSRINQRTRSPPTVEEVSDAHEFYRQFFSLMFDEYFAFRKGLLDPGIFAQWMKWRMDDYSGRANYQFLVCDTAYDTGWEQCKDIGPSREDPFKRFLENIHACHSYSDVEWMVNLYKSSLFWRVLRSIQGK
jgi:hypothetical protein